VVRRRKREERRRSLREQRDELKMALVKKFNNYK
jgi:hypothetical protein